MRTSKSVPAAALLGLFGLFGLPALLAYVVSMPVARAAGPDEWPQFRGPGGSGVADGSVLPRTWSATENVAWAVDIPGRGWSSPIVWRDRIFVTSAVSPGAFKAPSTGIFGNDYAAELQKQGLSEADILKKVVGRDIELTTESGALRYMVYALDAKTGKVIWHLDAVKHFAGTVPEWGHACSPLIDEGRLVVQVGGKGACLVALDPDTGKEVWRSLDDPPGYSSPVVLGGELVYFTPHHVVGLERSTGKLLWREKWEGILYNVSIADAVLADGVVLTGNYWSGSKAVRLKDKKPQVAWEGKQLSLLMCTPLVRGKHVYALDRFRGLKCVEAATGKVLWENEHVTPRDRNPQASLAWVGSSDRALILNTPGELLLVRLTPEKLIPLGKAKVIGKTWAHPAFAAGCVFARSDDEIVCVPLVRD